MIGLLLAIAIMSTAQETVEFSPHPGPQEQFLASSADIVIYGGARGGGKSYALLLDALRHIEVPGYRHVIYRRTSEEITKPGCLWDESTAIYPLFGGVSRYSKYEWKFPSGAVISFGHCEHVNDLEKHKGRQFAGLGFDELTGFEEVQFWLLMGSNRSVCGVRPFVRATCNPVPNSWVFDLISWWIDEDGLAIPSRAGVIRWFVRVDNKICWADSREEIRERYGDELVARSLTFIPAKLHDNPALMKSPEYLAALQSLPEIERRKHLDGNWKEHEGGIIKKDRFRWYEDRTVALQVDDIYCDCNHLKRFATIDTAGTSEDRVNEERGDQHSYSVVAIWDFHAKSNMLLLRHVWRAQVEWTMLETQTPEVLKTWNVRNVGIENAHLGTQLGASLRRLGYHVEMLPTKLPNQNSTGKAKYDRAVVSGLLTRIENGWLALPKASMPWVDSYVKELCAWTGLPKETADQIDVSSYASYYCPKQTAQWGGVISPGIGSGRVLGSPGSPTKFTTGARR